MEAYMKQRRSNTPMSHMHVASIALEGKVARLEPLQLKHAADLYAAGQEARIWRYMSANPGVSLAAMEQWIEIAQQAQATGHELPFAIVSRETDKAVGSTRDLNIIPKD